MPRNHHAPLWATAAALLSLSCASAPTPFTGTPFIHDDYAGALAQAKQKGVPLFVDASAPWCHSCVSMQAYVFTDAKLAPAVDRCVWLELDMEKPENAVFRTRYPVEAFPTYFIIDPRNEHALIRWVGGCSVDRLLELVGEASLAYEGGENRLLAKADSLFALGNGADAAVVYQDFLSATDPKAPHYGRTVESLLFALSLSGENEKCAKLAQETLPVLRHDPCAGNVVATGLDAAIQLPKDHPDRPKMMADLERQALEIVNDRSVQMAADDRSGVYIALLDARDAVSDEKGCHMIAEQWSAFLDGEAAAAPTPEARAVFDSHRLSAYIELGTPEKALPFLEQSERDFPEDYNPPARIAIAYKYMKQWDEGIAAAQRALAHAYGPRRLLILQNLADLYEGKGDKVAARRTIEDAVQIAESLPDGQRSDVRTDALKKKLASMG